MKRSPLLRRSRIKWKQPRRRAREAVFEPYVHWLLASAFMSCVVCGTHQNIQGSHVGKGGTGLKHGRACDMVRMCGPGGNGCHQQWEQKKLYFSPTNGWDRERRETWARRWRLKSWHDYIVQAPVEDMDCISEIAELLRTMEQQEAA